MSVERVFRVVDVSETKALAACLGQVICDGDFVALSGDLGAGKTHFSQGVGAGLGVGEPIASPTFNLVFEYTSGRIPLFHFDLYRLDDASELEDIDFFELADSSTAGAALVEWADKFPGEMPDDRLEVNVRKLAGDECDSSRDIRIEAHGAGSERLLKDWMRALDAK